MQDVDYFTQCYNFKNAVKEEVTDYLHRYSAILPSEVIVRLLAIDELLKDNMLVTPNDHEIELGVPLTSVKFHPEDYIDVYSKLGNEILSLNKIVDQGVCEVK